MSEQCRLTNTALFFSSTGTFDDANRNVSLTATTDTLTLEGQTASQPVVLAGLATPTADGHAATKLYVDSVADGLDVKPSVHAASAAALTGTWTYDNGTAGVGATLTDTSQADLTFDGVTMDGSMVGKRFLIKNESDATENGIYEYTTQGVNGSASAKFTRVSDMDEPDEISGATVFVESGSTLNGTRWHCTTNDSSITIGNSGSDINWTQYGAAASGLSTTLNNGQIFVGNGSNEATGVAMSGDINIDNSGATTIQTNAVETTMIADNAVTLDKLEDGTHGEVLYYTTSGAPARLAVGTSGQVLSTQGADSNPQWIDAGLGSTLNNGQIFVGNGTNEATGVAMSGDVTMDNAGVVTIADNAVEGAMLADTLYKATLSAIGRSGAQHIEFGSQVALFSPDGSSEFTVANDGVTAVGSCTAASYITSSDRKWKDNLAEIDDALALHRQLHGYTWTFNALSGNEGTKSGGIVHDELRAVLPDAVRYNAGKDGYVVDYNYLHALSIQSVNTLADGQDELRAENADLRAENADLRARLDALSARMDDAGI